MNFVTTSPPAQILIVDDEPANIAVLANALDAGYEVRFATSGAQALALARALPPDLVLLDVLMADMDGFAVLQALRADPLTRNIPVIFVSAMDDTDDQERGFTLGAVDYIIKPISPPLARARVRTHLELKRQRDLLEQLSVQDALTGIANRRRFDSELTKQWHKAKRAGTLLTLMLIDVDHFKAYNDNYGHGPGDVCLRQIAQALQAMCARADDLVARYGGEEFVVLSGADGRTLTWRLLQAVAALDIPHAYSNALARVSVSIGALELVPEAHALPEDALTSADQLLYQAKHAGRNRALYQRADRALEVIVNHDAALGATIIEASQR